MREAAIVLLMLWVAPVVPKVTLDPRDFPQAMPEEVAPIATVFRQFPDDASVLYQVAALHARAGHTRVALAALRQMVATGAGLHPRGRDGFDSLSEDPEYRRLIAQIRAENPLVLRARRALEIAEGDLVPEGIAYSRSTGRLYLGSVKRLVDRFATDLPDPNGITVTPDGKYLFVAGWHAITRIDVASGAQRFLAKPSNVADGCFDGLYWAGERALVGVQNCVHESGRVMRLRLSADLASIERADVLESYNPLFQGITTAALVDDRLFFVANTQLRKYGKPGESFEPLVVLDVPLD